MAAVLIGLFAFLVLLWVVSTVVKARVRGEKHLGD